MHIFLQYSIHYDVNIQPLHCENSVLMPPEYCNLHIDVHIFVSKLATLYKVEEMYLCMVLFLSMLHIYSLSTLLLQQCEFPISGTKSSDHIKMAIKPVFPVPHVLVICSCNHEGVDGSGVGLCLRTGEAVQ